VEAKDRAREAGVFPGVDADSCARVSVDERIRRRQKRDPR